MQISFIRSLVYFVLAGICEIGGGYLVWLWIKEGKSPLIGLLGGFTLFLYGIVATFQPGNFGRVYAAYGGIFILLAMLWGWQIDGIKPDRFDWYGSLIALFGVLVIMYAPR